MGTKKLGENLKLLDGNQWLPKILLVHLLIIYYTIFMIEDREFVTISRNNPVLIFFLILITCLFIIKRNNSVLVMGVKELNTLKYVLYEMGN